jgi:hypothetical protein
MLEEIAALKAEVGKTRDDTAAVFTSLAERARKIEARIAAFEVKA